MKNWKSRIAPVLALLLAGVVLYDHLPSRGRNVRPTPTKVDAVALGRAYAPVVASTLGDAWLTAARTITDGKSVSEAQKSLQDGWHEARAAYFKQHVAPELAKILPEGREPKDAEERAAVAKLWSDFAKGLKGGR